MYLPIRIITLVWITLLLGQLPSAHAKAAVEYDLLFLDTYLAKNSLDIPLEVLTTDFEQFYLPLAELAELLELPLQLNQSMTQVSGWFIQQKNQVSIDFSKARYHIGEQSGVINSKQWLIDDDVLYLSADAIAKWFGIHADIKTNSLKINLSSDQPLPRQAKLARQKKRQL